MARTWGSSAPLFAPLGAGFVKFSGERVAGSSPLGGIANLEKSNLSFLKTVGSPNPRAHFGGKKEEQEQDEE
jgi:hypothetical protein